MQLAQVWSQFISFKSVTELWTNQPTYLLVQILFIVGGIVTFLHGKLISFIFLYKNKFLLISGCYRIFC